jgi:hypothetical protein
MPKSYLAPRSAVTEEIRLQALLALEHLDTEPKTGWNGMSETLDSAAVNHMQEMTRFAKANDLLADASPGF